MENEFSRILSARGFSGEKARQCADIFTRNSLEGIYSHGVNRFPRFVEYVEKGLVIPDAEAEPVHAAGALEQWNGNLGPGPLNARRCTRRAMSRRTKRSRPASRSTRPQSNHDSSLSWQ